MKDKFKHLQIDTLARTLWAEHVFGSAPFTATFIRVRKDMATLPGGFGLRSLIEACTDGYRFLAFNRSHQAFRHARAVDVSDRRFALAKKYAALAIAGAFDNRLNREGAAA